MDCGGCALKMTAFHHGHGPVAKPYTTTETVAITVTWVLACSANSTGMASTTGTGGDGVGNGEVLEGGEGGLWDLGKGKI